MSLPADAALLCYDGSRQSSEAIRRAGRLLAPRRAVVLHAWDVPGAGQDEERLGAAEATAASIARTGAELARSVGFEAEPLLVRAHPRVADAILRTIHADRPDVVVMGSRGLSDFDSALLGSVSTSVVHESERPVLVVPPTPTGQI